MTSARTWVMRINCPALCPWPPREHGSRWKSVAHSLGGRAHGRRRNGKDDQVVGVAAIAGSRGHLDLDRHGHRAGSGCFRARRQAGAPAARRAPGGRPGRAWPGAGRESCPTVPAPTTARRACAPSAGDVNAAGSAVAAVVATQRAASPYRHRSCRCRPCRSWCALAAFAPLRGAPVAARRRHALARG